MKKFLFSNWSKADGLILVLGTAAVVVAVYVGIDRNEPRRADPDAAAIEQPALTGADAMPSNPNSEPNARVERSDRATLPGATLSEQERENFAADPGSMGFSEADRQFLREHGVTEGQARAAEEVARRKGIN